MHQNQNPALNNRFPPPPPSSSAAHHSGLGPSWDATAFIQQQQQQQQQQIRQNGLFSPTNKGFPPSSSSASTSKSSPKNRHPNGSTRKTFILSLTLSFIAILLLYIRSQCHRNLVQIGISWNSRVIARLVREKEILTWDDSYDEFIQTTEWCHRNSCWNFPFSVIKNRGWPCPNEKIWKLNEEH